MRVLSFLLLAVVALAGCDSNEQEVRLGDAIDPSDPSKCLESVVTVEDLVETQNQVVRLNNLVTVSYVGTLVFEGQEERFDGSPNFTLALRDFVGGFQQGVAGRDATDDVPGISPMRIGERRIITIPPNLAYGYNGVYNAGEHLIPRCATLMFNVTLLDFS